MTSFIKLFINLHLLQKIYKLFKALAKIFQKLQN